MVRDGEFFGWRGAGEEEVDYFWASLPFNVLTAFLFHVSRTASEQAFNRVPQNQSSRLGRIPNTE